MSLDKPCKVCGKPIHYAYSGPIQGVCGRCADRHGRKRRPARAYHRAMVVGHRAPKRRSTASTVVLLALMMVGGAVAGVFLLNLLFG